MRSYGSPSYDSPVRTSLLSASKPNLESISCSWKVQSRGFDIVGESPLTIGGAQSPLLTRSDPQRAVSLVNIGSDVLIEILRFRTVGLFAYLRCEHRYVEYITKRS